MNPRKPKKPKRDSAPAQVKAAAVALEAAGIEDAALEAKYIVSHVLNTDIHRIYLDKALLVAPRDKRRIARLVRRRISGVPVQYLLRSQDFYGLTFTVDRRVLIPRPETELLVETALSYLPASRPSRILDLCTGSGCIAVAMKHQRPDCDVTASDISRGALQVARKNAAQNRTHVRFIRSDLMKKIDETFNIIVSNPPYIHPADYQFLDPKVSGFEPRLALVGGEDGLTLIRRIIASAGGHLTAGGYLMLEIGFDQREAVTHLFKSNGFDEIKYFSDYVGFDRIVVGKKSDKDTQHV